MRPALLWHWGSALALLLSLLAPLRAQELSVGAGVTTTANLRAETYSWEIDYRQYLWGPFAASLDWINEGHFPGHQPDGFALEGWYNVPLLGDKLSLSIGAGSYFYFDTELPPDHVTIDSHGIAPIFSGSLTGYVTDRWFWRATYNRINPPTNDIKVNAVEVGLGYWLGQEGGPKRKARQEAAVEEDGPPGPANTVTVYGGWRVSNTRLNRETLANALEYRRVIFRNLDASISYVYEGDPKVVRRSGVAVQGWAMEHFPQRWGLEVGMGFGAYFYVDRKTPATSAQGNPGAAGGIVSPMIAKRFGDSPWSVRLIWNRIITNYDRDSDVWMVGAGFSWR